MAITTNEVVLVIAEEERIDNQFSTIMDSAFKARFTSEALEDNMEKTLSAEILNTREESDLLIVSRSAGGSISAELSWGTYDKFLEAFLCSGFVSSEEDPNTLVLVNGSEKKSFTIEKQIANKFRQFYGMCPSSISFDVSTGSIITMTINFMGTMVTQTDASIFADVTVLDATTTSPMTSSSNVGNVEGLTFLQSLNFEINNNLRERRALGSPYAFDIGLGTFSATGSGTMYFTDASMYDVYRNNEDFGFSITFTQDENNYYVIEFNRVKLETYSDPASAKNEDVMLDISFQSLKNQDPTKLGSVVIRKVTSA